MAAEPIGVTEAAVLIPEIWYPKMLEGRYAAQVIAPRVLRVDGFVAAKGNKLNIPIEPAVTAAAVGASGAITITNYQPTEVELTVDQWYHSALAVEDIVDAQAHLDVAKGFVPTFGKVLAKQIDEALAALYSDVSTNSVGASTDAISDEMILAAIQKLVSLNVPVDTMADISMVLHSSRWSDVKAIDKYSFIQYTGQNEGGMLKYAAPAPYGVPIYFSTTIDSSASAYQNMLFHRQAFACGVQKNFRLQMKDMSEKLAKLMVADILFGVKTVRENHACLLLSKTA